MIKLTQVLFVCLGNICRSPTAEAVFRQLVDRRNLNDQIHVNSAGTGNWHIGSPPDIRSQKSASNRGVDLSCLRAKKIDLQDIILFDFIIAMDLKNLQWLKSNSDVALHRKIHLFLEFSSLKIKEIPDPYYGDQTAFERVLDLIELASHGLLDHIQAIQQP